MKSKHQALGQKASIKKTATTIDLGQLDPVLAYLVKAESRLRDLVKLHYIAECLYGTFACDGGEGRSKRVYEALNFAYEALDDCCNGYSVRHKEEWLEGTCLQEALEHGEWLREVNQETQHPAAANSRLLSP